MTKSLVHPYIPNSVPAIREAMLKELQVDSIEEIYQSIIPDDLLYKERLHLPEPILSEYELKRHVQSIMDRNITAEEYVSFLGAGCYRHQVPAVCDELNSRGEFLTAYCGDTYSDHGKMQAIFEYASMMGELLDADVVTYTCYDGGQAVTSSLGTALRVQQAAGEKRDVLLVPETMNPEIYSQLHEYWRGKATVIKVKCDRAHGVMDLKDLQTKLKSNAAAAVLYENPSYLGFLETQAEEIASLAHEAGALVVASSDPACLGVMESPLNLGADLVCGDIQPLGMHMQFGGGQAGYIACANRQDFVAQLPTYLYGITRTGKDGTYGWGRALNSRCSHGSREKANEYFGTETGLWGITAGIYLASMGPKGMEELGNAILVNLDYLVKELNKLPNVTANVFGGYNFQEAVVNFDAAGKTVKEINKALLEAGIFGGKDISGDFPWLGESALYCVSELTTAGEIHKLTEALSTIVRGCC